MRAARVVIIIVIANTILSTSSAQAHVWPEPNWPELYEPNQLLTLHLQMSQISWDIIRYDMTFDIEVAAYFWLEGEEPNKISVSVRRKSCDALPNETTPFKISLKIDIDEYYNPLNPNTAETWHGIKKLSLENGDDVDVLAEGLASNLHRMASVPQGYGYDAGRACWVKLYTHISGNDVYRGVYVSAENIDRKFLENRNIYMWHQTWLYRYRSPGVFELRVGDDSNPNSPAVAALCYDPFACIDPLSVHYPSGGICSPPNDVGLIADMNEWVNMQGLLTMEAVNFFIANPDSLFSTYHNARFFDFNLINPLETRRRMYFSWDHDLVMQGIGRDIYEKAGGPTVWQQTILGNETFRTQYNQILKDLTAGPLSQANIHAFLDMIETDMYDPNEPSDPNALVNALAADPYNQFDNPGVAGVQERFNQIRTWISDRTANVQAQVEQDEANLDGVYPVNFKDFAILAGDWRQTGPGLAGDVNQDQAVDGKDIGQMSRYWLSN